MPRYTYKCSECEHIQEVHHPMGESLTNCTECDNIDVLVRIPSIPYCVSNKSAKPGSKPGALVKKHIEEAKKELKKEKQRLKNEEYK